MDSKSFAILKDFFRAWAPLTSLLVGWHLKAHESELALPAVERARCQEKQRVVLIELSIFELERPVNHLHEGIKASILEPVFKAQLRRVL